MTGPAPISKLVIAVLLLLIALAMVQVRYIGPSGNDWRSAINLDGRSYYEYLRMFLYPNGPGSLSENGVLLPRIDPPVIKQFSGTAVAIAPFVLVAHTYSLLNMGKPEDGYSLHYQAAVGLAAWCWLAVGLWATRSFLLDLGATDVVSGITLIFITLGTGLSILVIVNPSMSHVYGFAVIALLFRSTQRLLHTPSERMFVACAALLGLATLIRPVNLLVALALPMASMNSIVDRAALRKLFLSPSVLKSLLVFASVISIQGVFWYAQTGSFIVRSYPEEGFHWDRPHVLDSLFSVRNGLFFYWPVLTLAVPGTWFLWRHHRPTAKALLLFLIPFVYVTSSWWNWAYGDNFGQRTYLDTLVVFAVPIAFATPVVPSLRIAIVIGGSLLCALNLFQGWQYNNNLFITGQLDRYRYIFLETDPAKVMLVGGHAELPLYAPHGYVEVPVRPLELNKPAGPGEDGWNEVFVTPVPRAALGRSLFLEVDLDRTEHLRGASRDIRVALALRNGTNARIAHHFRMNFVPDAGPERKRWHYAFNMLQQMAGGTLIIMTTAGSGYHVDDVRVRLSVPR